MNMTFRIPESNLETLREKFGKLARRAVKLGLTPPTLVEESVEEVKLVDMAGIPGYPSIGPCIREQNKTHDYHLGRPAGCRRFHIMSLEGEAPTLPGHKLVCVLEHGETELGNIIRSAPGMECPERFREAAPWCDHCKTSRRRLETFVLVNEQGSHLQVGRNCLADFCRDAEAAANMCAAFEILDACNDLCNGAEDEDFFGGGCRTVRRVPVEDLLATTARVIRAFGWMSRTAARNDFGGPPATAALVSSIYFNRTLEKDDPALYEVSTSVSDDDKSVAAQSLEWIHSRRGEQGLNDYLYNLTVLCNESSVAEKHFGIACSLIPTFQRHLGKQIEFAKRREMEKDSQHFGEVKVRGRWVATFLESKAFDGGQYADVRYMHRFLVEGNIAVWWTTNEIDFAQGDDVLLIATVKGHDEFRGVKQTTLTRCDVTVLPDNKCECGTFLLMSDKKCPGCKKKVMVPA